MTVDPDFRAVAVSFSEDAIIVGLDDGRPFQSRSPDIRACAVILTATAVLAFLARLLNLHF